MADFSSFTSRSTLLKRPFIKRFRGEIIVTHYPVRKLYYNAIFVWINFHLVDRAQQNSMQCGMVTFTQWCGLIDDELLRYLDKTKSRVDGKWPILYRVGDVTAWCRNSWSTISLVIRQRAVIQEQLLWIMIDMLLAKFRVKAAASEVRTSCTYASNKHPMTSYSLNMDTIFGDPEKRFQLVAYKLTMKFKPRERGMRLALTSASRWYVNQNSIQVATV